MNLTFLYSAGFVREWERQRLTDSDLQALDQAIEKAPNAAPVIRGSGGLRKLRFAPPSRHTGKRGSMRVGFAYFRLKAAVFVVAIFAKSDSPNFSKAQLSAIAAELALAERNFK
jgi:hypothetical protein